MLAKVPGGISALAFSHRDRSCLLRVPELTMTASHSDLFPTMLLQHFDQFPNLHDSVPWHRPLLSLNLRILLQYSP